MRIKERLRQHRRDFTALYECEHCGETKKGSGYDDVYVHNNVIPAMACAACGKTAGGVPSSTPVVPEGVVL